MARIFNNSALSQLVIFVLSAVFFPLVITLIIPLWGTSSDMGKLHLLNYTQKLDHFERSDLHNLRFQQRLLVNDSYWAGAKARPPIFAYLGGVDEQLRDPGLYDILSLSAVKFKALLVSIEHRFTGASIPLGSIDLAMANHSIRACLSIDNVLQDYADIILSLKANYSAQNSPVIVAGSGYGGALAAFFRTKYPDVAIGAHASSTPIKWYGTSLWCHFVNNNSQITQQLFPECRFFSRYFSEEMKIMMRCRGVDRRTNNQQ